MVPTPAKSLTQITGLTPADAERYQRMSALAAASTDLVGLASALQDAAERVAFVRLDGDSSAEVAASGSARRVRPPRPRQSSPGTPSRQPSEGTQNRAAAFPIRLDERVAGAVTFTWSAPADFIRFRAPVPGRRGQSRPAHRRTRVGRPGHRRRCPRARRGGYARPAAGTRTRLGWCGGGLRDRVHQREGAGHVRPIPSGAGGSPPPRHLPASALVRRLRRVRPGAGDRHAVGTADGDRDGDPGRSPGTGDGEPQSRTARGGGARHLASGRRRDPPGPAAQPDGVAGPVRLGGLGPRPTAIRSGRTDSSTCSSGIAHADQRRSRSWSPSRCRPTEMDVAAAIERVLLGEHTTVDLHIRTDAGIRPVRLVADPLADDDGKVIRVLAVAQDLTETRRAAERMSRVQAQLADQRFQLAAQRELSAALRQVLYPGAVCEAETPAAQGSRPVRRSGRRRAVPRRLLRQHADRRGPHPVRDRRQLRQRRSRR